MNKKERNFVSIVLIGIFILTALDLITDTREGVPWWHLVFEASVGIFALVGVYFLLKGNFTLKQSLDVEKKLSSKLLEEAQAWKEQSKKYLDGLGDSINAQLDRWNLTPSEKDVALLLIKGFSLKEIAELRSTAEKTVRAQSTAIYAKSGVAGRPQLAAFFLEDLLMPRDVDNFNQQ
ncbi:MAG: hypothetical protein COW00_06905 [Bdellovibrio sp. CG12_big_fil_rev_8_21_14_0_65_39_13]|nr:MAG: hypothetical protein COW78_03025 [Bdellovibrio sp. CG22_combo_CG10-13_8_21_14_all_39_27]PIQ60332.1 MAG: hypothetical protein COW00_06905 [Bdellovibrio sp. CG12_big_fil_rev_8_21_14_0_65_39_13]PIR35058.1 MAG: hypothetical protein COV37_10560 [Bdellovibrio sp. CG11_big_fil_rev_8_21_14_0_20_39_38]PJB53339.1 MAG: hypothetical protein CO099_07625 [Bdellovibrio sp. CG_4_9_14_3_um_filter_39_7]